MGMLDRAYIHLPLFGQHVAVSAFGVYWKWMRFGGNYRKYVQNYRAREWLDSQTLGRWTQDELIRLLSNAVDHIPYYHQTWSKEDKVAARAGKLSDLPILEKAPLRADPLAFIRSDMKIRRPQVFYTSGTTGTPISNYWTVDEIRNSLALREARSLGWAGVSYQMPRATISGRMVEPDPRRMNHIYRFNLAEQQVYFSAFHLRTDSARHYVSALQKHSVRWLTGYASSYYLLAKFILEQNLNVPQIHAVIPTSEKLTVEMRECMQDAYRCRVFEEYSTVENAVFASECEKGRLHVSTDAGVVEILRPDGVPCLPGEVGEVVATSFVRSYQPFIRYRLGDMAAWDDEPCPCGRSLPVIKEVVGRIEDIVTGADGRKLVRFGGVFFNQPNIIEGQIIQETQNRIRVKVVPTTTFSDRDRDNIIQRVQARLGPEMEVVVEPVPLIPRTSAGKFRGVISLVKQDD